jgi:hypothetical protein
MLHQAICFMQLAMVVIKNSIKTANDNVWRRIVSQKPIGIHSVYKHCETSCKRDVTLCNALKMRCSVAAIVAKSRTWFYFVQWLLQQKYCETCWLRGMIHLAISCATCIATKLPDMLRDKLHSVTAPVYRTRRCVCKRQHQSDTKTFWFRDESENFRSSVNGVLVKCIVL